MEMIGGFTFFDFENQLLIFSYEQDLLLFLNLIKQYEMIKMI